MPARRTPYAAVLPAVAESTEPDSEGDPDDKWQLIDEEDYVLKSDSETYCWQREEKEEEDYVLNSNKQSEYSFILTQSEYDEAIYCEVCKFYLNGRRQFQNHLLTKAHRDNKHNNQKYLYRRRIKLWIKLSPEHNWMLTDEEDYVLKSDCATYCWQCEEREEEDYVLNSNKDSEDDEELYCEVCDAFLKGWEQFQDHLIGKRHRDTKKKIKEKKKRRQIDLWISLFTKLMLHTKICGWKKQILAVPALDLALPSSSSTCSKWM